MPCPMRGFLAIFSAFVAIFITFRARHRSKDEIELEKVSQNICVYITITKIQSLRKDLLHVL